MSSFFPQSAMSEAVVPFETVGNPKAEHDEDLVEAWSPFKDSSLSECAPVPWNSPVDSRAIPTNSWDWEEFPEILPSPSVIDVPSPPPPLPKTIHIGRLFSPVAMACSGHLLATAFSQQTGRFWTGAVSLHEVAEEPHLVSSFAFESTVSCVAFCDASARSLLFSLDDGSIVQMELANGSVTHARCEHDMAICGLAVSPGFTRAFSCDQTGCVCVWDPMLALANLIRRPSRTPQPSDSTVSAHPLLERRFVSAGGNVVRLWEEEEEVNKVILSRTEPSGGSISRVEWPEENNVLVGWTNGSVQSVDIRQTKEPLWSIGSGDHGREILGLCATASSDVVTISADNCLRVLRPSSGKVVEKWGLSGGSVWDARCEDKLVTAMVPFVGSAASVIACARDQTWWRWRDNAQGVEQILVPPNGPGVL